MTDKEMLLHLIGKLQLKETKDPILDKDEFSINNEQNYVVMSSGKGYDSFYVEFWFDNQDNLIYHAVAE